jgi:hypothetical protein
VVLAAQEPDGGSVLLRTRLCKLRPAAHHDERQKVPVLRIPVGDEGHARVFDDVPHTLEACRGYVFGFLVEGDVNPAPVEGVADRDHVRLPGSCGGGEPGDAPPD